MFFIGFWWWLSAPCSPLLRQRRDWRRLFFTRHGVPGIESDCNVCGRAPDGITTVRSRTGAGDLHEHWQLTNAAETSANWEAGDVIVPEARLEHDRGLSCDRMQIFHWSILVCCLVVALWPPCCQPLVATGRRETTKPGAWAGIVDKPCAA